jgi:hypothetical protein
MTLMLQVQAMELLGGTWRLVYTSNSDVIALLSLTKLPLVSIQDITQTIEPLSATVVNSLVISVPFSTTAISTTAAVTVQSPKRLNLRFEKGTISTPELMTDANLPDSTMVLGQYVDLKPLKSALEPVKEASRDLMSQVRLSVDDATDRYYNMALCMDARGSRPFDMHTCRRTPSQPSEYVTKDLFLCCS